jgi:hypothetical protein
MRTSGALLDLATKEFGSVRYRESCRITSELSGLRRFWRSSARAMGWAFIHGGWLLLCKAANEHKQQNENRKNCQNNFL